MNNVTDRLEDRLRADAPPLTKDATPTVAELRRLAAARHRRRTRTAAAVCCGVIAVPLALLAVRDATETELAVATPSTPDLSVAVAPAEEPVEVDLVVNSAGVLEVHARRGDLRCVIRLGDEEPLPPAEDRPPNSAVPLRNLVPAVRERVIDSWINAGYLPGLHV